MVVFIGHGMLRKYSGKFDIKHPESLKTLQELQDIPLRLQEDVIYIKQNKKLEDDSIIVTDDEIHMYLVPFGG
jgi:hypothetical protein